MSLFLTHSRKMGTFDHHDDNDDDDNNDDDDYGLCLPRHIGPRMSVKLARGRLTCNIRARLFNESHTHKEKGK